MKSKTAIPVPTMDNGAVVSHWESSEPRQNGPHICLEIAQDSAHDRLENLRHWNPEAMALLVFEEIDEFQQSQPAYLEHPIIRAHINPEGLYSHKDCVSVPLCVDCNGDLIIEIMKHEKGSFAAHIPGSVQPPRQFVLGNPMESLDILLRASSTPLPEDK